MECITRLANLEMDFEGQLYAEKVYKTIIVVAAVVGWVVGFVAQDAFLMMWIVLGGTALSAAVCLPPWSWFRRHPLVFLPVHQENPAAKQAADSDAGVPRRKKQKAHK
eukprot:TRINITY_DN228_c0_g2_i1.p2 TRINITY_DN228_c0_g2~~TRINITY_DN228_c0_g2_i1.p2  ORF type:complete len:108 (+),score=26.76 TRINITY_DN228_c0_g2_i1:66-389(+)